MSVTGIAMRGFEQGQSRALDAARTLARDPANVPAVVDLGLAEREVEAAAKIAKTEDEMLGHLIDTFA